MADISTEINAFRSAVYGEEVRGSMITLAQKINTEVESNTTGVTTAISNCNTASSAANTAATGASTASTTAANAASSANAAVTAANNAASEVRAAMQRGDFKGDKGDKGDTGEQGASGVQTVTTGWFSMYVDDGLLYLECPDDEEIGNLQNYLSYDQTTGNLYYITD